MANLSAPFEAHSRESIGMSLRDVRFALDGDEASWSLRSSLDDGVWQPLARPEGGISLRDVYRRFTRPGAALRKLANENGDVWQHVTRNRVVIELRQRLRDPATMLQINTDLCGPYALLFEFARRNPTRYVQGAAELLRIGVFTARSGKTFVAESDLRSRLVPEGTAQVDWLYAATIRDSENISDDIDDAQGDFPWELEGASWPWEIEEWIEDILGLKADYFPCFFDGELAAIRAGQRAVERGGVAILLVDINLLKDGNGDTEEDMWWRRMVHKPGGILFFLPRTHCKDDALPPDHYVALLGELRGASSSASEFHVMVWSFGSEYKITGEPNAFGEYLYAVITGEP